MEKLDKTDYALLANIADADRPLWKKRIHTRLQGREPPLPGNTDISLQSVGRRINALYDRGLVDSEIVESPDTSQSMIIGYTLTNEGRRMLDEKRGDILGTYAGWSNTDTAFGDRETLLQLLNDELELNEKEHEMLQKQDMKTLLVFTLLYQALRASSMLGDQTMAAFREILDSRQENNNENGFIAQYGGNHG